MTKIAAIFFLTLLAAFSNARGADAAAFKTLCDWMTGSFSSQEQSQDDPQYFDIRLRMSHIWADRTDGYWLYVEQARADAIEQPYRQRVYKVVAKDDGTFESIVYELPGEEPLKYAGAWNDATKLQGVSPENLKLRDGCGIVLKMNGEKFEGSTRDKACPSSIRGASYASSEVQLFAKELHSWDRGWDKDGKQVWGAVKGAYKFKRLAE